jgi:hypothetical protein
MGTRWILRQENSAERTESAQQFSFLPHGEGASLRRAPPSLFLTGSAPGPAYGAEIRKMKMGLGS